MKGFLRFLLSPVTHVMGFVVLFVVCLCLFGCNPADGTYKPVERIMMHDPHQYSLFLRQTNETIEPLTFTAVNVIIHDDVKTGEPMWAEMAHDRLDIHIHSVREINGAGWDHGEDGQGQTVVIQ